jgi:hypothetical protein
MLTEQLRSKLQAKLVDVTCSIKTTEDDKKLQVSAISEHIKLLKKRQNAISKAIKFDDDEELIQVFGEFYQNELGLK